jgi:hypothetical protein
VDSNPSATFSYTTFQENKETNKGFASLMGQTKQALNTSDLNSHSTTTITGTPTTTETTATTTKVLIHGEKDKDLSF